MLSKKTGDKRFMFYTIYDAYVFRMRQRGIDEKEAEAILKNNGIKSAQLKLLKDNCIEEIPEEIFNKVLKIAELSKLEMKLMLGIIPSEVESSYLDNITAIAQLLTEKDKNKDRVECKDVAFRTENGDLYHGDCLDILPGLQSESVDLIFADPPFNLKKEYANGRNDDLSISQYIMWSKRWIDECIRILKPGGSLYIYNIPKWCIYYAEYLSSKLHFQNWIAIDMKNSFPIRDKYTPSHYGLLYFTKGTKPNTFNKQRLPIQTCRHCGGECKDYGGYKDKMNLQGVNIADVWYDIFPVRNGKNRPYNELSLKLLDRIISFSSNENDVVLDPFGGSGTTYAAAELLNRRWIGIELGDCSVIVNRMKSLDKDRIALKKINDEKNTLFTKKSINLREKNGFWLPKEKI